MDQIITMSKATAQQLEADVLRVASIVSLEGDSEAEWLLQISFLSGEDLTVAARPSTTVSALKANVLASMEKVSSSVHRLSLHYGELELEEGGLLEDFDLCDGCELMATMDVPHTPAPVSHYAPPHTHTLCHHSPDRPTMNRSSLMTTSSGGTRLCDGGSPG